MKTFCVTTATQSDSYIPCRMQIMTCSWQYSGSIDDHGFTKYTCRYLIIHVTCSVYSRRLLVLFVGNNHRIEIHRGSRHVTTDMEKSIQHGNSRGWQSAIHRWQAGWPVVFSLPYCYLWLYHLINKGCVWRLLSSCWPRESNDESVNAAAVS